ncbi:6548_t:CDS:2 [Gigaspora margarita]|uniref:6548_t:CDS:1 n=1 Tax=Gigaspora margarita TaxID=4874 RepID=A0ABN7VQT1_GIGMA|nr:6548_t:CDS:2 [Gigaspora margarita]
MTSSSVYSEVASYENIEVKDLEEVEVKNVEVEDIEVKDIETEHIQSRGVEVENIEKEDIEIEGAEAKSVEGMDAKEVERETEIFRYDFSLLSVGYTFQSWNDVDSFLKTYSRQFGFAIIKKRVGYYKNGMINHRFFRCEFGGIYNPKKQVDINAHCEQQSKHQGCDWHINLNFPQDATCITYCNDKKEVNDQQNTVFINEHAAQAQHSNITQIVSQPLTIPSLVTVNNQRAAAWHLKYSEL